MSLIWDGQENHMVCEKVPPEPTVDEAVARRIRLEECLDELRRCLDTALDRMTAICELLPQDRDAVRMLDDLHVLNARVYQMAKRLVGRG